LHLKFNESDDSKNSHSVYIQKYRSEKKSSDKPVGKTLAVLNIPPYATEESIERVFSIAGQVEKVMLIDSYKNEHKTKYQVKSEFFNEPRPFKFQIAFIVYKKSESLDLIFRCKELPPLSTAENPLLTGIAKWTDQYNKRMVNVEEMQEEINEYMKHYDKVKKAEEMQGDEEVDDDGWVTVGKKGNNAGFKQKESVISKLEKKLQDQRKKTKNLSNFYSFELRESKKQQLIDLRKKFNDDKTKMHSMKQNRKFKPY
jgi:ribosomal RNA-processing protein 7